MRFTREEDGGLFHRVLSGIVSIIVQDLPQKAQIIGNNNKKYPQLNLSDYILEFKAIHSI